MAKLDQGGTVLAAQKIRGIDLDVPGGVAINSSGEVVISGAFRGNFKFGSTTLSNTSASYEPFVATCSSEQQPSSIVKANGTANSMALVSTACINSVDEIFITGGSVGNIAFGKTVFNINENSFYVAKLKGKNQSTGELSPNEDSSTLIEVFPNPSADQVKIKLLNLIEHDYEINV